MNGNIPRMHIMKLTYHKGTLLIHGEYSVPYSKWDPRAKNYRAQALFYKDIIDYLENSNISYEDNVLDLVPCNELVSNVKLRDYQDEALEQWLKQKKGVVVMPTGSGKTILAIKIIENVNASTLIIVPTLDLVSQWKEMLEKAFILPIGEFTGSKKDLRAITVSTYDSAYINSENLGNKFKLLVFDEVHHLPSEGYRQIAEMFAAPFRLGLTATYERPDNLHEELPRLIGGKVFEIKVGELSGNYLAEYEISTIKVALTEEEEKKYHDSYKVFRDYLIKRNIRMNKASDFKKIVMRSGTDPEARKAILSRNRAERIAYNSKNKIEKIKELLNREDRTIIFTRYNDMVHAISRRFFIPCITHKTDARERKVILKKFKNGKYSTIISSHVLDEGINVPEANIGIILSGTGSSREFVQRLGRLLRPQEGKKAILYELISKRTMEIRTSYRRKK